MLRKQPLVTGEVYHILNKSIEGYEIFPSEYDYARMVRMIRYFSVSGTLPNFARFLADKSVKERGFEECFAETTIHMKKRVQCIAYCIMPTHFHLVLKQAQDGGISSVMSKVLNGYARYFNTKYKRKGHLWQGAFKNVLVETDEQMYHLTRYLHLNPVTAGIIGKPEDWRFSSFGEYISPDNISHPLCDYKEFFSIRPADYRSFVIDQAAYQRELAILKGLILE